MLLLSVVLVAMSSAACMTSAEVEADNIEVTWRGLLFQGVPVAASEISVSTEGSFELAPASLAWAKDLDAKARVKQVRIVPAESVQNLSFLELVTATMAAASNPEKALVVASYQRASAEAQSPQIAIANPEPIDVTEIWAAKQMRVTMALLGQLPTVPWSVDVTIVLDGQFTVRP